MLTEKDILSALKNIIDPDFDQDIVSLGFVRNIKINKGDVSFNIELTTPACPVKDEFQRQAKEAISSLSGVENVVVVMTSQKPQKRKSLSMKSTLKDVRSIIAVSSCKGGVGKSTIAAQLSSELARRGFKVGLVDADIHGPSIPSLFNLNNISIYQNQNKQFIPIEKNNLKIMSFGFLLGDAPAVMRGPMVTQYVQQILHNTAWGELDYLFIDMPPGTGDIQLTVTQTVQLNGAVIITTPQTLSLIDVARGILMFEKVNVPILGLIENMSYFQCDKCDKKHTIFGKSAQQSLKDRFGIDLLIEIPLLHEMILPLEQSKSNSFIIEAVDKVVMALGKNTITQKEIPEIKFDSKNIMLNWSDGTQITVANRDLRLSCECALCVNEITGKKLLKEGDVKDDIAPITITPLGNYALGITWNDRHSSGIYPYKTIKKLMQTTKA